MDRRTLDLALERVGADLPVPITITVAGSAMFLLGGHISRPVGDCDLVEVSPQEREPQLIETGNAVSPSMGLKEGWLNTAMTDWEDYAAFPTGWQSRTRLYKKLGNLTVRYISLADAVALKAMTTQERGDREADYEKDLDDLGQVNLTNDVIDFAVNYLNNLDSGTDYSRIVAILLNRRTDFREQEEQAGSSFIKVLVPLTPEAEQQLIRLVQTFIRDEGDPETYSVSHRDNGRFLASSLSGGSSRFFSIRVDRNGSRFVHDDSINE